MPDNQRSPEGALESLVEILDEPGWQQWHRQRHVAADLAIDRNPLPMRAPGLDLVGQRKNDRGAIHWSKLDFVAGEAER